MAELPRLRVGLTLDSATFIRETNNVINAVNNLGRQMERQSAQMSRSFSNLEGSVNRIGNAFRTLGTLIGVGSFAAAAREVTQLADAYILLQGRLRVVADTSQEVALLQDQLVQISVRSRVPLESVIDMYTRLALVLKDQGVNTQQLIAVTNAVADAARLSGKNFASVSAGLFQFSQGMAQGQLRGHELLAVMEQVPPLAVAIGRGLGIPISKFKELAEQGFFTSERVLNALIDQQDELAASSQRMGTTFEQAFGQVRDAMVIAFGEATQTSGEIGNLVQSIVDLASYIRSDEFIGAFREFAENTMQQVRETIVTTKREWDLLMETLEAGREFLAQFKAEAGEETEFLPGVVGANKFLSELGLAAPQTLEALRARVAEINEELARMMVLQRMEPAGEQKAVRQAVIESLMKEKEALFQRRMEMEGNVKVTENAIKVFEQFAKTTDTLSKASAASKVSPVKILGGGGVDKKQLAFDRRQIRQQYEELSKIAEDTIKRGNRARFQAAKEEKREQERLLKDRIRDHERLSEELLREQQRLADRQQEILEEPFKNALGNIQGMFTDTFEQIYSGGITSFSDLATSIKDIFIRLAAELTTLMIFKPVLEAQAAGTLFSSLGLGGAGAAGVSPAQTAVNTLGGGFFTPGGRFIPNVRGGPQVAGWNAALAGGPAALNPAVGAGGLGLGQAFGFGAAGALGGGAVGGLFGGRGQIGGAIGGAAGAIAGGALAGTAILPGIGTAAGALIGGIVGTLAGGGIGSLFGGGGGQGNQVAFGPGNLGSIRGTGAGSEFVSQLDQQILGFMTARQEQIANAALANAPSVAVQFSKTPSANDLSNIARSRIAPIAQSLGFNPDLIAGTRQQFTAEQQTQNLQQAIELQKTISRFQMGSVAAQFDELNDKFSEMQSNAARLGIAGGVISQMHQREAEALSRRIRIQQQDIALAVGAATPLSAALNTLQIQMEENWRTATDLGVSTANLSAEHRRQAIILAHQDRIQRHSVLETIGAWTELQRAIGDLNASLNIAAQEANRLGYSAETIHKQFRLGREQLIQEDRLRRHASLEVVGLISPLQRALGDLDAEMKLAAVEAERLGYSTAFVAKEQQRLAAQIVRQHEAQIDALALSIVEPFERLLEPLQQFSQDLGFQLLNPLQQSQQAGEDFRAIAQRALAGDIPAIEQFQAAGQRFIEEAGRFGASPAQAAAAQEVLELNRQLQDVIINSQREASSGVEEAIRRAEQRNQDKLNEVVAELRLTREEIQRLRRQ